MTEEQSKRLESGFSTSTVQTISPVRTALKGSGRFFGQSEEGVQQPQQVVQVLNLSTTGTSIILPYHNHVLFDNVGVNLAQFSLDNQIYTDFLEMGKAYIFDDHHYTRQFYLKSSAATTIMRIITW